MRVTRTPDAVSADKRGMLLLDLDQLLSAHELSLTELLEAICFRLSVDVGHDRAWIFPNVQATGDQTACARYVASSSPPDPLDLGDVAACDLAQEAIAAVGVSTLSSPAFCSLVSAVLLDAGQAIGALVLRRSGTEPFGSLEVEMVETAAITAARGLQRSQSQLERAFAQRQAQAIRKLLEDGSRASSVAQAGVVLAEVTAQAFGAERAGVYLIGAKGVIDEVMGVGISPELSSALDLSLRGKRAEDSPVWRQAAALNGPVLVQDARDSPARPGGFVQTLGFQSYVAIPLLAADGPVGLVIVGDASRRRRWSQQDQTIAQQLVWEGALVVNSARLRATERVRVAELTHQAFHDPMTGLANRALLMDRLTTAISTARRYGGELALLLMDLDGFKAINDTLGHHHGDVLLEAFGQRLLGTLREADTLARLGGDEFAIILGTEGTARAALAVAGKIDQCLETPFILDSLPLQVTASIGIALFPDHGSDASSLLQHADIAMYSAKRARHGAVVYDHAFDTATVDQLTTYTGLHTAIDNGELRLHYQPKVELLTGRLVGVEALVRWQHPNRGLLGPADFLPVAEATGLIERLTGWVLREASQQWLTWSAAGLELDVAVNISAHDLRRPDFADQTHELLSANAATGLADRLILEITETAMVGDPGQASRLLNPLRDRGVRVSIDDFGAGYSSLSQLRQLPVDELKMDLALIRDVGRDPRAAAIARAVIDLGHRLSLTVVAEGIEDQRTLEGLRELDCDQGQGFHLGRPAAPSDLAPW